jgi:IS6 family transposase
MSIFSGRHYPKDVILWAVRWYCRYGVSYRDLEEMLTERGVPVDHTTIYRWVQKYGPELDKRTRWYRHTSPLVSDSWRVDETYIRVGGRWCYLYRAVTKHGRTLDFYMSTRRNTQAATRLLGKALRGASHHARNGEYPRAPLVICTDKAPTYAAAIATLVKDEKLSKTVEHRQVKYLGQRDRGGSWQVEADPGA